MSLVAAIRLCDLVCVSLHLCALSARFEWRTAGSGRVTLYQETVELHCATVLAACRSLNNHYTKRNTKNMDLNAYVLAMAIVSVPRHKKNRQAVPEPEFEPFDIRDLRGLSANTSQPRQSCHQGKTHNNVSEALPA